MQYMKLKDIFQDVQNEYWMAGETMDKELLSAMDCCMPHSLYMQAEDLIHELFSYKEGDTENEDKWILIDFDNFILGITEAHQQIMEKKKKDMLSMLDYLDGDDEIKMDERNVDELLEFLD